MNQIMKNYIFLLSKEDVLLAREEAQSVLERYDSFLDSFLDENLLIVKCSDLGLDIENISKRLAYTHSIYSIITFFSNDGIEYSNSKMISLLKEYALNKDKMNENKLDYDSYVNYKFDTFELLPFYVGPFSFRLKKISGDFSISEKDFSSLLLSRLILEKNIRDHFLVSEDELEKEQKKNNKGIISKISSSKKIVGKILNSFSLKKNKIQEMSKEASKEIIDSKKSIEISVNLKNPVTRFELFVCSNVSYLVKFEYDFDKSYNERNTQFLPARHPSSMKAKLSRTFVNLTGILPRETLLDPFCGIGTCLIEAGMMGVKILGSDIDDEMLFRAKTNLDYFKLDYRLKKSDARIVTAKCDAIVCDLPYGKNTKNVKDLDKLSIDFLNHAYELSNVIIVGLPDFCNHKKILSKTPWKLKCEFNYYIHKSLSKKILKLVK